MNRPLTYVGAALAFTAAVFAFTAGATFAGILAAAAGVATITGLLLKGQPE